MLLKHFFTGKIAHSSYILAGRQSCAVIDPRRDVDLYVREARALGVVVALVTGTAVSSATAGASNAPMSHPAGLIASPSSGRAVPR